jgi:hypothetical protein
MHDPMEDYDRMCLRAGGNTHIDAALIAAAFAGFMLIAACGYYETAAATAVASIVVGFIRRAQKRAQRDGSARSHRRAEPGRSS